MKSKVGIIDYDSGNFASVWTAFEKQDCSLQRIRNPEHFHGCSHVVLPGVGAFSSAIDKLQRQGLFENLQSLLQDGGIPFLGICVGMQVLAEYGEEFTRTKGFEVVTGSVIKFDFSSVTHGLSLPHMGWNDVAAHQDSRLFHGLDPEDASFYFVHSYRLQSDDRLARFSYTDYGGDFIAAFEKDNIFGVQFHPEKSQRNGYQLIKNFIDI